MKKIVFTLLALALATVMHAQQYAAYVYQDGELKGKYALAEKPVLTFVGDDLVVSVGEELQIQFIALGTVVKFEEVTDGIHGVPNAGKGLDETSAPVFSIVDGWLTVTALAPGQTVRLYTTDGRMVATARANTDGTATMALVKGTTIVQAGKFAFKVFNK